MKQPGIGTSAKTLAIRGIAFAALPLLGKAPGHIRQEFRERAFRGSLADRAHRHRISFPVVEETPSMVARREAGEAV